MTDPTTPDPDELASALLDGELVDGAPVEPTPALRRRADELRVAVDAIGAPVPPLPAAEAERLLAAAIAAADDEPDADGIERRMPAAASAPGAHGSARRRRRIWLPPPAVAAAVVVVIAIVGIGLIVTDRSDHGSRGSLSAASEGAAANKAATGGTSPAAAVPDTLRSIPRLGSFSDRQGLQTELGSVAPESLEGPAVDSASATAGGAAPATGAAPVTTVVPVPAPTTRPGALAAKARVGQKVIVRCDDVIRATDPTLGARLAVASATIAGRAVLVFSHPEQATTEPSTTTPGTTSGASGGRIRLTVADQQTCGILFAIQR